MSLTVFVADASRGQGGHVAQELLKAGHTVHSITRDPNSPTLADAVTAGVKFFPGDFDTLKLIVAAAQECSAAFINVGPVPTDPEGEAKHGRTVTAALKQAGVSKVVQSSVALLEKHLKSHEDEGVHPFIASYFKNKANVESSVKNGAFDQWTILRPARLLNGFVAPHTQFMFPELAGDHVLKTALSPDIQQSVIDPLDVGIATRLILEESSDKYNGHTFDFAVEALTMKEIVNAMNSALECTLIRLEHRDAAEAQKLRQGDMRIEADLHLNRHPEVLRVDLSDSFGLQLHTPQQYFVREKQALQNALTAV